MTTRTLSIFLLSALAVAGLPAAAEAAPVSYTAAMDTSVGNPVTHIMIWETDGTNTNLDYAFEIQPPISSSHDALDHLTQKANS